MPKKASGYIRRTASTCISTSSVSPNRLNEGDPSLAEPWPRRTNVHARHPRRDAWPICQRVCAAEPVMVCRKMTIGASGARASASSSFAHSTVTSGSLHVVTRPTSGGSTRRRSSPRRERRSARAKLAFALRAHGVGL
eukprot:scaffold23365_cov115-Isochrysis_galbana.AAC.9